MAKSNCGRVRWAVALCGLAALCAGCGGGGDGAATTGGQLSASGEPLLLETLTTASVGPTNESGARIPGRPSFTMLVDLYSFLWLNPFWPDPENAEASIIQLLDNCSRAGVDRIALRVDHCGNTIYRSATMSSLLDNPDPGVWFLRRMIATIDPVEVFVREAHARGMPLLAWMTPFDCYLDGGKRLVDEFLEANPSYWWLNHDGSTPLLGYPCYAYPEIRNRRLSQARELLAKGIDGFFISFLTHAPRDKFVACHYYGFNAPVIAKYRARYKADPVAGLGSWEWKSVLSDGYSRLHYELRRLAPEKIFVLDHAVGTSINDAQPGSFNAVDYEGLTRLRLADEVAWYGGFPKSVDHFRKDWDVPVTWHVKPAGTASSLRDMLRMTAEAPYLDGVICHEADLFERNPSLWDALRISMEQEWGRQL